MTQVMTQVELIKKAFNVFNGKNLEVLVELYDDKIHFQDPVVTVDGLQALNKYYQHAYSQVNYIKFNFTDIISHENTHTCQWDMEININRLNSGKSYLVQGASVIRFSETSQKVIYHRDYLDLGALIYEKVPVMGSLVRAFKKKLS